MAQDVIKVSDTSRITSKYMNKWVALSEDYKEVIASGETLSEVLRKTSHIKRKAVFRVLPNLGYVPFSGPA